MLVERQLGGRRDVSPGFTPRPSLSGVAVPLGEPLVALVVECRRGALGRATRGPAPISGRLVPHGQARSGSPRPRPPVVRRPRARPGRRAYGPPRVAVRKPGARRRPPGQRRGRRRPRRRRLHGRTGSGQGHDVPGIGALGRFVRSDRVDLVLLDHAPPLLRHRVIRDGVLLYARSDAERARFVRRRLREYLDLEPRLREQNRLRLRRLREGRPRPPSPCGTNTPMPGPWPRAPGDRSGPGARAVGGVDGFTPGRTALRSGRESAGSGRPW